MLCLSNIRSQYMGDAPENILQHIRWQRGGAEHNKQALLGLAIWRGELLRRWEVDICLNPGHRRDSREALVDKTHLFSSTWKTINHSFLDEIWSICTVNTFSDWLRKVYRYIKRPLNQWLLNKSWECISRLQKWSEALIKWTYRRFYHLAGRGSIPYWRYHLSCNKLHGHPTYRTKEEKQTNNSILLFKSMVCGENTVYSWRSQHKSTPENSIAVTESQVKTVILIHEYLTTNTTVLRAQADNAWQCVPAAVLSIIDIIYHQPVARRIFEAVQFLLGINCWAKVTVANHSMTWSHKTHRTLQMKLSF